MIIKILSRAHAGAALDYGGRVGHWATPTGPAKEIYGTLPLDTPMAVWREEFTRIAALRPDIRKNVVHVIVSFSEEDRKLSTIRLAAITHEVQEQLGYGDCPSRWTEHLDGQTQHLHGVVSAISYAGERVDRTGDRWRGQQISRGIERENGLCRVSNVKGKPVLPPLPIPGQDIVTVIPRPPGWTEEVVSRVRQAFRPGCTLPQLRDELAILGVGLEVTWTKDGSKIQGLGFRFAGDYRIASKTHESFSLKGLQKQGLDFSAARDIPLLASPVLGPPASLAVAKIPTLGAAFLPKIAAALTALATLPPPLPRIPEVLSYVRPKISLIQSVYALATEFAARLWRATSASATAPASDQPGLPGR